MANVRDLANECSGAGYEYLGHMCAPEILRKGHNTDEKADDGNPDSFFTRIAAKGMTPGAAAAPSGPYKDAKGTDWSRNADGSKKK